MAKANPQFSADQLQDFARRYFDRLLAESKRMQLARKFKRGELEHFITHLAEIEDRLKDWKERNQLGQVSEQIADVMAHEGINLPTGSHDHLDLSQQCLKALIEVNQRSLDHYSGFKRSNTSANQSELQSIFQPQPAIAAENSIGKLSSLFCKRRAPAWRERTFEKYQANLALCSSIIGNDIPVLEIDKAKIRKLRDVLSNLPANWSKTYPEVSPIELSSSVHSVDIRILNPASVNAYLGALSSFFSWCVEEGYVGTNPVSGIRATEQIHQDEKRDPFTIEQLQILFDSPIYKGCQSDSNWKREGNTHIRDSRFWLPLTGLYSGMRLGELLALKRQDFIEENGIGYFKIRKAKSISGVRKVPIHPELIKCGIIKHISSIAEDENIFSGFTQKAYSKFFKRFQLSVRLDNPKLVFHSFRHTFTDALRAARIEEPIAKALLGHSDGSVTGSYGAGYPIEILNDALSGVEFRGLKICHVYQ